MGKNVLICILLPGRFVQICAAVSLAYCHDRHQVFLIVHCTIFSEHFSVIELLGNPAPKVEVAQTDIEKGLPVIIWTT